MDQRIYQNSANTPHVSSLEHQQRMLRPAQLKTLAQINKSQLQELQQETQQEFKWSPMLTSQLAVMKPFQDLTEQQKQVLNRVIRALQDQTLSLKRNDQIIGQMKDPIKILSKEIPKDRISSKLTIKEVEGILEREFKMHGQEISALENQVVQLFAKVIIEHQNRLWQNRKGSHDHGHNEKRYDSATQNERLTNITEVQKKELEIYQNCDYSQYPVQPCIRSLYYISKIAQQQQINIYVPPTILILANEDNRFMYNCPTTGNLLVENKKITEQQAIKFIKKHMQPILDSYNLESKLLIPKYVIRIAQNLSRKNEIKVYFNLDSMIADALVYWGNCDMAIQLYIKQKQIRPQYFRYYMKKGLVYKATQITNAINIDNNHLVFKTMQQLVDQYQGGKFSQNRIDCTNIIKNIKNSRQRKNESSLNRVAQTKSLKLPVANKTTSDFDHKENTSNEDKIFSTQGQSTYLNATPDFSSSLNSKTSTFYAQRNSVSNFASPLINVTQFSNDMQIMLPSKKLKKAYCCTTDNLKNIKINQSRPSAIPAAERMTLDLYRLFSQYFLKTNKFGNIENFVCDFIEGENGIVYLLQIKSFSCEGVLHPWQQQWQPSITKAIESPLNTQKDIFHDQIFQSNTCEARIVCQNEQLNNQIIEALTHLDMYSLKKTNGKNQRVQRKLPKALLKDLEKYKAEVELQRNEWREQKEKEAVCPLVPLVTFKEVKKERVSHSPIFKRRGTKILMNQNLTSPQDEQANATKQLFSLYPQSQSDQQFTQNQLTINQSIKRQKDLSLSRKEEKEISCCLSCYKILDCFRERFQALTFQSEEISKELRLLKLSLVHSWTLESFIFVFKQYQHSRLSTFRVPMLDKLREQKLRKHKMGRSLSTRSLTRQNSPRASSQVQKEQTNRSFLVLPNLQDKSQERFKKALTEQESSKQLDSIKSSEAEPVQAALVSLYDRQQMQIKQQESIAKLHLTPLQKFKRNLTEITRNQPIIQSSQTDPTAASINESSQKQDHSQNLQNSGYFLRKYSQQREVSNPALINITDQNKLEIQVNPKIQRQQISTIEEIYKEIPPQQSIAAQPKQVTSTKSQVNINSKELSKLVSHFGLRLNPNNLQENDNSRKVKNIIQYEKLMPLNSKGQSKGIYRQFIAGSQSHRGANQLPQKINSELLVTSNNMVDSIKDHRVSQNKNSLLRQNNDSISPLSSSFINLPNSSRNLLNIKPLEDQSQSLFMEQRKQSQSKQQQQNLSIQKLGSQSYRVELKQGLNEQGNLSGREKEADLSMYFNNKRKIQNANIQLAYLKQLNGTDKLQPKEKSNKQRVYESNRNQKINDLISVQEIDENTKDDQINA